MSGSRECGKDEDGYALDRRGHRRNYFEPHSLGEVDAPIWIAAMEALGPDPPLEQLYVLCCARCNIVGLGLIALGSTAEHTFCLYPHDRNARMLADNYYQPNTKWWTQTLILGPVPPYSAEEDWDGLPTRVVVLGELLVAEIGTSTFGNTNFNVVLCWKTATVWLFAGTNLEVDIYREESIPIEFDERADTLPGLPDTPFTLAKITGGLPQAPHLVRGSYDESRFVASATSTNAHHAATPADPQRLPFELTNVRNVPFRVCYDPMEDDIG